MRMSIRELLFGPPIETAKKTEHRLPNFLALPVFASDALSSVAYGTEEILLVLALAGTAYLAKVWPISIAIAILMLIVGMSYRRAIMLYPQGGGSYSVAKDNLGVTPGLVAAAALTIDYILTVAVSVSAGVAAMTSAFPSWLPYKVDISVILVGIITLANLRGVREAGIAFALPAYTFITTITLVIITSAYHVFTNTIPPVETYTLEEPFHAFTLLLLLRAFSNGCAALTGVEAVSNGVSAFQPPEAKNAAKTLLILVLTLAFLFLGVGFATLHYKIVPHHGETVISQLARANFGRGALYFLTQLATLLVLSVAANTSFAGFPRLAAIVARDGYAPKMFSNLGDRLVHNQGIIVLAIISIALIIEFKAVVNSLIPLYAVGVFLCFTLTQAGMVWRFYKMRDKGWINRTFINAVGGVATASVMVIIIISKFMDGAWIVVILIPALTALLVVIKRHYEWFDRRMTLSPDEINPLCQMDPPMTILVLISSDIHRGILEGIETGRMLAHGRKNAVLRAVHIELDPEKTKRLKARWAQFVEPYDCADIRLDIVPSPYRRLIEPLMEYLDKVDSERENDRVIIVLPEFETGSLITKLLHNFTGWRIRNTLLNRRNVFVLYDRFFMR